MSRHVVVIGAGIIGAMSAIHILEDGDRVTLLDPDTPGGEQAASYGNSGWLSSHSVIPPSEPGVLSKVPGFLLDPLGPLAVRLSYFPQALPWLLRYAASGATRERLAVTAHALRGLLVDAPVLHRTIAEQAGVAHLIEHAGLLHVFPSRKDFTAASLAWGLRREVGVAWREIDGEELRNREPSLDSRYQFALLVNEAGHCVNPGAYVAGLVRYACTHGVVRTAQRATGFRIDGGRLRAVRTDAGDIACDAAVIAAGGRSKSLAAAAGDRVSLETERGYHVMISNPEAAPRTPLMVSDRKVVATTMQDGLRVGGQVEIASFDAAPNWRRADILRKHALALFPALPRDLPENRFRYWLGRRPSTPDGLPCIGFARSSHDIVHAFGHGHVGLASSARSGRLVAQLLAGRKPEIALDPFDARRFA
jgi:D-amino-acid dehydrogenase